MRDPDWVGPPTKSIADTIHAVVKTAFSLKAGPAADLFALFIPAPFERRWVEWMERCEMRFRHLATRDKELFERLRSNEEFISVFIAASQAAVRTHHAEKRGMLASAAVHAAEGAGIGVDLQLIFVRFVDELTPGHFQLLALFAEHEAVMAKLSGFEPLRQFVLTVAPSAVSSAEFKLLCNDLQSRVLVRFSEAFDDFDGLAVVNALATEDSGVGARVAVTDLARSFLAFVGNGLDEQPSNDR
jgi:hypothetical protein